MSIWLDFFSLFNDLEPVDQGNENVQAATTRWMELSAAQLATVDFASLDVTCGLVNEKIISNVDELQQSYRTRMNSQKIYKILFPRTLKQRRLSE